MRIGIRKATINLYVKLIEIDFSIRKFIFGFKNANRLLRTVDNRAVIPILRKYGASIGENCDVESPIIFHNCRDYKNLVIGRNCHIGKDIFFDMKAPIIIENSVTISMRVTILTHLDVGKSPLKEYDIPLLSSKVELKKGCYIGASATILSGVTVGKCSIVGAGAVVTKDVPPFSIVGGTPAKIIKKIK